MYQITREQVEAILNVIYQTNIPVSQFDALRKLLQELPEFTEEKKK